MKNILLFFVFTAAAASAQDLSVGVLGGAPFTDVVNGNTVNGIQSIAKSTNFTIGPALQVNLPASFRIEVDALFRPYSFNLTSVNAATDISSLQWRFPFLLQYRFGFPLVKPFVEGGSVFRSPVEYLGSREKHYLGTGTTPAFFRCRHCARRRR